MKKLSFLALVAFFVFAGANHFINPTFYYPLIPDYLPFPKTINVLSGIVEIGLGILLLVDRYRKSAAYMLIALMVAFIPSHVYFIMIGSCVEGGLCVPSWVGWFRLIVIHPIIIWWIYSHSKPNRSNT